MGIGLSVLATGGINMIVLILTLTTLSIAASFLQAVRRWQKSYDAGIIGYALGNYLGVLVAGILD